MSEEEDNENTFLLYTASGVMNLVLAALNYFVLSGTPQFLSWLFVIAGVLFFVAAFTTRYEDFGKHMSKEGDDENRFLVFIGVGIMFLCLGAPDLVLNDSSQLSSWLWVVAGVFSLIAAFMTGYGDFGGFQDLG